MDNFPENRKRRVQPASQRLKQRREQRASQMRENIPEQNPYKPKPQTKLKIHEPQPKESKKELKTGRQKRKKPLLTLPSLPPLPPFLNFLTNINNLITIGVVLIVVITVHFFFIRSNSYRIFVGDYHIATIPFGYTTGEEFVQLLTARIEGGLNTTIDFTDEIVMRPSNTRGGGHVTVEQALTQVSNIISYQVEGAVFVVDGVERFIVPSAFMADELIRHTAQNFAAEGATITNITTPGLQIVTLFVDYVLTIDWQTALATIGVTTREEISWVVAEGQSFWSIGAQLGLTVEEIMALNPTLGHDHILQPGEIITVAMDVPLFTIHTTEETDVITNVQPNTEHIHNPELSFGETNVVQEGAAGQMRQVFSVSRTNGVETNRSLISQEYLTHPIPYIIEIGS